MGMTVARSSDGFTLPRRGHPQRQQYSWHG
jgi:hypothetical protein